MGLGEWLRTLAEALPEGASITLSSEALRSLAREALGRYGAQSVESKGADGPSRRRRDVKGSGPDPGVRPPAPPSPASVPGAIAIPPANRPTPSAAPR